MIIEEIGKMTFEDAANLKNNICAFNDCEETDCGFKEVCDMFMYEIDIRKTIELPEPGDDDYKYKIRPDNMFCKNCREPHCEKNDSTCAMIREYLHYRSLK